MLIIIIIIFDLCTLSPQDLKLRIIKACLQDLVDHVLVPYSGWSEEVTSEPIARPGVIQWNTELKNTTGSVCVCVCVCVRVRSVCVCM